MSDYKKEMRMNKLTLENIDAAAYADAAAFAAADATAAAHAALEAYNAAAYDVHAAAAAAAAQAHHDTIFGTGEEE